MLENFMQFCMSESILHKFVSNEPFKGDDVYIRISFFSLSFVLKYLISARGIYFEENKKFET